LHDRYVALYQKFADAWRVTDKDSLFDYGQGTSTETFTMRNWPSEQAPCVVPNTKPAEPATLAVAERACSAVTGDAAHNNCVFDVRVTGNPGFANTYVLSQRIQARSTTTRVIDNKNPTTIKEPVTFTATVARLAQTGTGVPAGTVQFTLDGNKVGKPVRLDRYGQATWKTSSLKPGEHKVSASYIPSGSVFLPSSSSERVHTVRGGND
jgi:hypothetical protein